MPIKPYLYLCFLLLIFQLSCKKEGIREVDCDSPTNEIVAVKKLIIGKWTWAYERYLDRLSQSYVIKTPQTEGFTRQYYFADKNVAIFQNNNVTAIESYEVTTLDEVTGWDMDREQVILLFKDRATGQRTNYAPVRICSDTLTLRYDIYSDVRGREKWSKG